MLFPVYIDLTQKNILIVGAGTIAARRLRTLCGFVSSVTVVAPDISEEVRILAKQFPVALLERDFLPEDLNDQHMVLAATNDSELNKKIYSLCKEKGIVVNVCSDQTLCDFQFPSVVQHKDVVIGINASGKNHRIVKETREQLEAFFQIPDSLSKYEKRK